MSEADICPWCNRDMAYTVYDRPGYEHDHTVYSEKVGVEIRGVYDGALFWYDPGCGKAWHRWVGTPDRFKEMRRKAQPYIDEWNQKARERA